MYKISVIIPIYNAEKYLRECLKSVVSQSLEDIEILCIDDGSNDGTHLILHEYESEFKNVFIYRKDRGGAAEARNYGLSIARGEYIAFLDADDYYISTDSLEYLYNLAKSNQVNIAGGNFLTYSEEINKFDSIKEYVFEDEDRIIESLDYYYPWYFWRFIFNRQMLISNNIVFPKLNRVEDPIFLFEVMIKNEKMAITSKQVLVYRVFEKTINIYSKKVVCDFMRGYLQLMTMSKETKAEMQNKILDKMSQKNALYISHIGLGNKELYSLINEIATNIVDTMLKKQFTDFWNEENVKKIYSEKIAIKERFKSEIRKYNKVIIYGAGVYGKKVLEMLNKDYEVQVIGFAITQIDKPYELMGHSVDSLKKYDSYKETALIIIAKKGNEKEKMETYAKKEGYKHTYLMDDDLSYYYINQLTDDIHYV